MNKNLEQRKEFSEKFKLKISSFPQLGNFEEARLQFELLEEEVMELWHSANVALREPEKGLVGMLDALVDIQYVLDGAVLHFGM